MKEFRFEVQGRIKAKSKELAEKKIEQIKGFNFISVKEVKDE